MKGSFVSILSLLAVFLLTAGTALAAPSPQALNPLPPGQPVKLIFIHHSTGENWLTDGYGDLGQTLAENNYFVSDTNYGWGPDGIGDQTDIPNWVDWFASDRTPVTMDALFNESGQNASYTRLFDDPGGENVIVMFKSCFPNSALEGSPADPPDPDGWLTVGHAKYVYNQVLQYFATRPDKLFIVITAPPLSDNTYAENARAFNNWLMEDWLPENGYTQPNVAVFDFYNVLTARDAHHWYHDGAIQHVTTSSNTLYYPSEDDHPSRTGSLKATEEFIPLLNIFYHNWQAGNPQAAVSGTGTTPGVQTGAGVIDDFDSATFSWEAYNDESPASSMTCAPEAGSGRSGSALRIDFDISANGWGTCSRFFDNPQDWSAAEGLTFYYTVETAGFYFDIDLYTGDGENVETYLYTIESTPESAQDWVRVDLSWSDFQRASWEENGGDTFEKADQVSGMAFGLAAPSDASLSSSFRVEDVTLMGGVPSDEEESSASEQPSGFHLPCGSAGMVMSLGLICIAVWRRHNGNHS